MVRKARAEFEITAENRTSRALNEARRGLEGMEASAARVSSVLARVAVPVAAVAGIGKLATEYSRAVDPVIQLEQRIRTATKATGDFEEVYAALVATAAATGSEMASTVDVFQSISRIRDDIGVTNAEAIAFTRTIQQLGAIGGSSTEDMSNGLRQLSQALAGGVVRSEEFQSILDGMPEVTARIAQGLDITQGELRQMVLDGRLLAEDVMQTILDQSAGINEEFERMPESFGRSATKLSVAWDQLLLTIEEATGIQSKMADGLGDLADTILAIAGSTQDRKELEEQEAQLYAQLVSKKQEQVRLEERAVELAEQGGAAWITVAPSIEAGLAKLRGEIPELEDDLANLQARIADLKDAETKPPGRTKDGAKADAPESEAARREREEAARRAQEDADRAAERAAMEAERDAERVARVVEMFDQIHMARLSAEDREIELAEMRLDRQLADLERERRMLEEHGLLTEELKQGFRDAEVDAEAEKAARIAEIVEQAQQKQTDETTKGFGKHQRLAKGVLEWDKANWSSRADFALGTVQAMTAGLAQENEVLFRLNQAAGIANAIVSTSVGVTKALELGPKGIPLAAIIAAAGAAEIATIGATSFGGGSARGSGTLSGVPSEAGAPFQQQSTQQSIPDILERDQNAGTRTLRIEFGGSDGEIAQAMTNQLRIKLDEEDAVLFGPNSRQALELKT